MMLSILAKVDLQQKIKIFEKKYLFPLSLCIKLSDA